MALAIHGFPRAIYEIDMLIRSESFERAYEVAAHLGYDVRGLDPSLGEKAVEICRVSKFSDDDEVLPLKFLLAMPPFEDVWKTREKLLWQNRELWSVSRAGLVKMKKLAGRLKDLADVEMLKNEES